MIFEYSPAKWLLGSIIFYQKVSAKHGILFRALRKYASLQHRFLSIITCSDISKHAKIYPDLKLPHPVGVVIHRNVTINQECMIMQLVTIGQLADGAVPSIGRGVYVGAGAKILGGITIGDHATIGANAVVLTDVPANATAVGVPARILTRQLD